MGSEMCIRDRWREDDDIEDIAVFGEWSGGSPDAEWGPAGSTDEEEDN